MPELTELETHRRLINAQIKREVIDMRDKLRSELLMRTGALESRISEVERAVRDITSRLMDLSLYENKLITQSHALKKVATQMSDHSIKKEIFDLQLWLENRPSASMDSCVDERYRKVTRLSELKEMLRELHRQERLPSKMMEAQRVPDELEE